MNIVILKYNDFIVLLKTLNSTLNIDDPKVFLIFLTTQITTYSKQLRNVLHVTENAGNCLLSGIESIAGIFELKFSSFSN